MNNRFLDNLQDAKTRVKKSTSLAGAARTPATVEAKIDALQTLVSRLSNKEVVRVEVPKTEVVTTEVVKEVEVVKDVSVDVNLEELEGVLNELREAIASVDLVVDNTTIETELSTIVAELQRIQAEKVEITLDPTTMKEELLHLKDDSAVTSKIEEVLNAVNSIQIPEPQEVVIQPDTHGVSTSDVLQIVTQSASNVLEEIRAMRGNYTMMVVRDKSDRVTRIDVSPEIGI